MRQTVWLSVALMAVAGSAVAADGNLTVSGKVVSTTCELAQNSKNLMVNLETVGANSLATAGAEAAKKSFVIQITGCSEQEKVGVSFEAADGVPTATGGLPNVAPAQGRASNVDIALYDAGNNVGSRINLREDAYVRQVVSTVNGAASLVYAAGYYATGAATAGNVKGLAKFNVVYQ